MDIEKKKKFALEFTDFINANFEFIKGIYRLFKTGETKMILNDKEVDIKSENFQEKEDTVFTTLLLAYMSMKQMKSPYDEFIRLEEDEMILLTDYIEYVKKKCDIQKKLEN